MAAVLNPRSTPQRHGRARPRLVVIEGGNSDRRRAMRRTYRRRRLAVLTLVVLGGVGLVQLLGGSPAGGTRAGDGAAREAPVVGSRVVAQPGDTLWDLAVSLDRPGDVRDTVDRLAEFNGTDRLVPGQVIEIPADLTT